MICLRRPDRGVPEVVRLTMCGAPCSERPTTSGCLEWWGQRAEICPLCWDAWCGTLEAIAGLPLEAP